MENRLGLIAVDEAHLIYDWQDFRQAYKRCKELHDLLPNIPIMALSATITNQVEEAAYLEVIEKGRNTLSKDASVLLPESTVFQDQLTLSTTTARKQVSSKQRIGKGKHMLPILKKPFD